MVLNILRSSYFLHPLSYYIFIDFLQKNIREYVIIESTYLDRNVTHSYNQNIALSIISQAKEKFYDMFCQLKKEIDENWI